jgi:hypothetical protein
MDTLQKDLDGRLDIAGWALFCLMSGVVLLVPALPDGTWLTATGAIIVGFAALRAYLGLSVSAFWTTLGIGFAAFGVGALVGLALPWIAGLTLVCGVGLLAEAVAARPRLA